MLSENSFLTEINTVSKGSWIRNGLDYKNK